MRFAHDYQWSFQFDFQTMLAQESAAKARYQQMWSQQQTTSLPASSELMQSMVSSSKESDASYSRMLAQLLSPPTEVNALCKYKI